MLLSGLALIAANLFIAAMCFTNGPVRWVGIFNVAGALYIAWRLWRTRQREFSKEEKLEALQHFREALMKEPASRDVYEALQGVTWMEERLRRQ